MRILWLKTELLHPVDKGGKIRTFQMLKELKREHHITYLTLDDGAASPRARELASEYADELITIEHRAAAKFSAGFYVDLSRNLVSRLPYAIEKYRSDGMRQAIVGHVARKHCDVVVCDFLTPAVNVPADLKCASVLFEHNVEAQIWQRHYELQTNPLKRNYLYSQWRKTQAFERAACHQFEKIVAVSVEDARKIERDYAVENAFDVPTGVDTDFFRPSGKEKIEPHNLVFTGSMDWLPNEDAMRFFVEQILPAVKRQIPDVTLTIVGRNPSAQLIEMSKRDASIVVTGRVEDVRPYIEKSAAYIVPIRIGGGTRLKIYEALAMEKPMISTTIGAEGLPLENETDLLLADSPEAFAAAIVCVLGDENFARELGRRSAARVRAEFGWADVAAKFADVCERARRENQASSRVNRQAQNQTINNAAKIIVERR